MAKNQNFSATITIGGALSQTLKTAVGGAQSQITKVGSAITATQKRQTLLSKSIDTFARQGKDVSHMREEYSRLGKQLTDLRRREELLGKIKGVDIGGKYRNMTREVGGLALKVTAFATASAAGIFTLAKSTADYSDRIVKASDNIGIHTTRLQELEYAAERGGLSSEQMGSAIRTMTRRISRAAQDTGPAVKAIKELRLEADALAAMTPDEALNHIADALEGVENMSDRARLAFDIFGDSAGSKMPVVLKGGSAALKQLAKDAHDAGHILSDETLRMESSFNDAYLAAKLSVQGVKNQFGAVLMPVVGRVMDRFNAYVKDNREQIQQWAIKFGELTEQAVPALINLVNTGVSVATTIGNITNRVASLVGGFDNLGVVVGLIFAAKPIASVVSFGMAVGSLTGKLLMLATGAGTVAGAFKAIGAALMANPIGLIIGGIAIAGLLIYKYWSPISDFMGNLWSGIKSVIGGFFSWVGETFSWTPLGILINNWGSISTWFSGLFDGITDKLSSLWDFIKAVFSWSPMGLIQQVWSEAFSWISKKVGWLGSAMNKVKRFFGFGGEKGEVDLMAEAENESAGKPEIGRFADVTAQARYETQPPEHYDLPDISAKANYEPSVSAKKPAGQQQANSTVSNTWQITIVQQPGQNAQDIIDELERRQRDRETAALYDQGLAYG